MYTTTKKHVFDSGSRGVAIRETTPLLFLIFEKQFFNTVHIHEINNLLQYVSSSNFYFSTIF